MPSTPCSKLRSIKNSMAREKETICTENPLEYCMFMLSGSSFNMQKKAGYSRW